MLKHRDWVSSKTGKTKKPSLRSINREQRRESMPFRMSSKQIRLNMPKRSKNYKRKLLNNKNSDSSFALIRKTKRSIIYLRINSIFSIFFIIGFNQVVIIGNATY